MWIRIALIPLLATAAFAQSDAPEVVVQSPHGLLHRPALEYPAEASASHLSGDVLVTVFVAPSGEVYDARIVTGPNELRRSVLQSVLQWHFDPEPRLPASFDVILRFDAAKGKSRSGVERSTATPPVKTIDASQLPDTLRTRILNQLALREGDSTTAAELSTRLAAIDGHIEVSFLPLDDNGSLARLTLPGYIPAVRIRVGGNVQAANLIRKVTPVYPPLAKQAQVQGTVRFSIIIGKDGFVQNVQLVSGHPLLVPASIEAVKQWVYKPTLLNGKPVEVITQADVNFTLVDQ